MTKYERTAILEGEVDVWFKNTQHILNEKMEVGVVKHISCSRIAIVEIEGTCYVSLPWNRETLQGMLFETRDTFDELVKQYTNAGNSSSQIKE